MKSNHNISPLTLESVVIGVTSALRNLYSRAGLQHTVSDLK